MTTLFVATTGGHLTQLYELARRIEPERTKRVWATFDDPQGRSLLKDEDCHFVPYIAERDVLGVVRATCHAHRLFRRNPSLEAVVSTGSAIALSFLPYATLRGIEAHYIESAARVGQPSLTGRILARVRGIKLYRQYEQVARGPWTFGGSVFDGFQAMRRNPKPIRRVLVTIGMGQRGFRRLIEPLHALLAGNYEVVWQTGKTEVDDLAIDAKPHLSSDELIAEARRADVVIAHSGCGSAIAALTAGKCPILVPRNPKLGEDVDNHQIEIAEWLQRRGLALTSQPAEITHDVLQRAATWHISRLDQAPAFGLVSKRTT